MWQSQVENEHNNNTTLHIPDFSLTRTHGDTIKKHHHSNQCIEWVDRPPQLHCARHHQTAGIHRKIKGTVKPDSHVCQVECS